MMGKKALPRQLSDKEAIAKAKMIGTSPQKLSLIATSIQGKKVESALAELEFSKKRVAHEVKKVLTSAIANAENNHNLDVDQLVVSQATVGKALVMKRFRARAKGRASRIVKPFSNLRIIVKERNEEKA